MWRGALAFAVVAGLLGESFEVARLYGSGGIALPAALRLTLFGLYGLIGALAYGLAYLSTRAAGRRLSLAAGLFAVAILVPWVNFDYLPRAADWRSAAGTLLVALVAFAIAALASRRPRFAAACVVFAALVVNAAARPASPAATPVAPVAASGERPNVVLLLIDTLRADHLGAYGYDRPTSPNFDRLAEESVVFERAIAQAAWTKPSVASLFTGRYVHNHGVMRSRDALGEDLPVLAELLRARGYRTAGFSGNPWITPEFRFDRGFATFASGRPMGPQLTVLYKVCRRAERLARRLGGRISLAERVFFAVSEESVENSERDAQMTAEVVEWLGDTPLQPFFLYVHFIGPHDPYDPPPELVELFQKDEGPFPTLTPPRVESIFVRAQPLDDMSHRKLVAQYDAAIAHTDALLGTVLDQLKRSDLDSDTLLIVTSDHGEEFYEHGNWRHGNQLYEEVIRVPLLMRWPGVLEAERRSDPAMLVDILPSVMNLVGVAEAATEADGTPLFAGARGDDAPVFSEHRWFEGGEYVSQSVQMGNLKMLYTRDEARGKDREEAYDLGGDASESSNLLESESVSKEVADLRELLGDFAAGAVTEAPVVEGIDPETAERLRLLGYDPGANGGAK